VDRKNCFFWLPEKAVFRGLKKSLFFGDLKKRYSKAKKIAFFGELIKVFFGSREIRLFVAT